MHVASSPIAPTVKQALLSLAPIPLDVCARSTEPRNLSTPKQPAIRTRLN